MARTKPAAAAARAIAAGISSPPFSLASFRKHCPVHFRYTASTRKGSSGRSRLLSARSRPRRPAGPHGTLSPRYARPEKVFTSLGRNTLQRIRSKTEIVICSASMTGWASKPMGGLPKSASNRKHNLYDRRANLLSFASRARFLSEAHLRLGSSLVGAAEALHHARAKCCVKFPHEVRLLAGGRG